MAKRTTRLEVDIVASDNASKVIRDVADDVDKLESDGATIDVDVSDNTTDELADIRRKLDDLSDEDRVIALKATADQLQREVRAAEKSLGRLDKFDGDAVRIRLEARDNASKKLDAIQAELRDLDGKTARVDVSAPGADELESRFQNLTGAGGVGALGRGGLIGGAVLGAAALADQLANAAIDAQTLADLTGSSTENASRIIDVFSRGGGEANDLVDVILNMNDQLRNSPELAAALNINLNDGKDGVDRFVEAVTNLNTKVTDTGTRAQLSTQLFGEEGVRQVGRVVTIVGDLQTAVDGVASVRVFDEQDVADARKFKNELKEASDYFAAIQRGAAQVGVGGFNRAVNPNAVDRLDAERGDLLYQFTGGLFGSGPPAPTQLADAATSARSIENIRQAQGSITIINPPGTPAATVNGSRVYDQRNGIR